MHFLIRNEGILTYIDCDLFNKQKTLEEFHDYYETYFVIINIYCELKIACLTFTLVNAIDKSNVLIHYNHMGSSTTMS